jgi:transcriptional regulator with XRE-family HTH domain
MPFIPEHGCKEGIADMESPGLEVRGREDLRRAFIEMRARGVSLSRCSEALKVARSTLANWNRDLEAHISSLRAMELEALHEEFHLAKEGRIRLLGQQLQAIRDELAKRGLEDVPTFRLLELQLSYYRQLLEEFTEPRPLSEDEAEAIDGKAVHHYAGTGQVR